MWLLPCMLLQVVGNVAQTMSTYSSAYSLLGGLFGDTVRH
jgi:hypothetical protein